MTAATRPARHAGPAHLIYVRHVLACPVAASGAWCRECRGLLIDADAESWQLADRARREGAG